MKKALLLVTASLLTLVTLFAANAQSARALDDPADQLTNETFNDLNPLKQPGVDQNIADQLTTPGGIMTRVLIFAFPIAGLILFVMLVWAGFEILMGASNKKSMDAGKQRATTAIVGFFLLFCSYWIAQIIEVVFKVTIL